MNVPIKEVIKSIPGFFGIRLEHTPRYDVIYEGDIEIRRYAPFIVAQITVGGPREKALDEAFKQLAAFIFGDNQSQQTLPMTNPVFFEEVKGGWLMSFYLEDRENIPVSLNKSITIHEYEEKFVAAYQFTGNMTDEKLNESKLELLAKMRNIPGYRAVSEVYWAQYDAPFTIPFMKKNEALVHIVNPS